MISLAQYLDLWAGSESTRLAIAQTVQAIASVSIEVSALIAEGDIAGALDQAVGENVDGDTQKALDLQANDLFIKGLYSAPVAVLGSEESDSAVLLSDGAPLAVTLDPLDGSSNIATNVSVGSIFGLYPTIDSSSPDSSILQQGSRLVGAGFVVYGPQTTLTLSLLDGTHVFTLSRKRASYWRTRTQICIPADHAEYAINSSNFRHWASPVREYIDECQAGETGVRGKNFNTRWVASLVAEAFRIFARGGVFLYPGDQRAGYTNGRLRLVYEANPISLLVEQAGGAATNGEKRILDLQPTALHQRTPFVFGSSHEVARIEEKHAAGT